MPIKHEDEEQPKLGFWEWLIFGFAFIYFGYHFFVYFTGPLGGF